MISLLLTAVLAGASGQAVQTQTYTAAYRKAQSEDKPLVVVVGATWCPACQNLKNQTLAPLQASGELDEVSVAVVDQDAEPALADQLKRGRTIPQVIVFSKDSDGEWRREQLTGFQSTGTLRNIVRRLASFGRSTS